MHPCDNASSSIGSLRGLHGPEHHDGEPIFSLRMWLGIPVSSRELRNSTGYCNCTVHRFVLLFLARELVHEPGIELVDISVGWRDDRSLRQPLWLGTVCSQVRINLGFEFFQVGPHVSSSVGMLMVSGSAENGIRPSPIVRRKLAKSVAASSPLR